MAKRTYTSDLSTDEKVLMAIVRAAEIFKRNHSAVFRNYGLSLPQYNILRVIEASRNNQSKMSDISRIMLVPGANITGLAKRLEKGTFHWPISAGEPNAKLRLAPQALQLLLDGVDLKDGGRRAWYEAEK